MGRHQMNPPDFLSRQEVSFLIQFYPLLYSLPGVFSPNVALRECMADLLHYYPMSMIDPMKCLYDYRQMHLDKPMTYQGDLEADYLRFLAKVQKAAKENPADVEFDFTLRKTHRYFWHLPTQTAANNIQIKLLTTAFTRELKYVRSFVSVTMSPPL